MSKDSNEAAVEKLKDYILKVEEKAAKELISSRGLTAVQAAGLIDASAVSAILNAVDVLCEGDQK